MGNKSFTHEIIQPTENLDVFFRLFNDSGSYVASHWHNSIEILYITSGSLQVEMSGHTYNLKEDDCILINSGVVHSTHCVGCNTSSLLQIPSDFLNRYMPDYKTSYFDFNLNSNDSFYKSNLLNIKELFISMETLKKSLSDVAHLRFTSLVFELIFQLYTNFRITIGSKQMQQSSLSLSTLDSVLEYTKLNYNHAISLGEIAEVAHLQLEYFCRKFKQYMGQTYLEYLNEIRLAHIYKDLLNTNNHLCDILETHGFTNSKLFYKLFREKFNCTPREVRKIKD